MHPVSISRTSLMVHKKHLSYFNFDVSLCSVNLNRQSYTGPWKSVRVCSLAEMVCNENSPCHPFWGLLKRLIILILIIILGGWMFHEIEDSSNPKQEDQHLQLLSGILVDQQHGLNNTTINSILDHWKLLTAHEKQWATDIGRGAYFCFTVVTTIGESAVQGLGWYTKPCRNIVD